MSESDIEQYHKMYLEKYNNEFRNLIANSILNIYAHTVNRFKKLDSVIGLKEDLVRDPAKEAAYNRVPSELIASLNLILALIMLVAHTYNHIDCNLNESDVITVKTNVLATNSENNIEGQSS